jgi:hypothetical protein
MTPAPRHLVRLRWVRPDSALDTRYPEPQRRWRYQYYARRADARRRADRLRDAGYMVELARIATAGPWEPLE